MLCLRGATIRGLLIGAVAMSMTGVTGAARGEGPRFETVDLFEASDAGYEIYRIPGIVADDDGTVLAYCEARETAGGDWGTIDLFARRSTDGGQTWGPPEKIVEPPADAGPNPAAMAQGLSGPGAITMNNPVAIVGGAPGVIHFLYCVEYARCFHMRSVDGGASWSEPVEITGTFEAFRPEYPWVVLATGPGHGIRLETGRLVVPVWLSTGEGGHAHRPSAVSTIFSDDGVAWHRGELVVRHPSPVNPSETVAVELSDGRVLLNIRHESEPRLRGVVVGPDGSTGWSPMRLDPALPEPVCMGSIVRYPRPAADGPDLLLFANPHNPDGRDRENLAVKVSYDDGRTWPVMRVVEPGPSGYSDLAVAPDGSILCFFERGAASGDAYRPGALTLARFNLEWLTGADGR